MGWFQRLALFQTWSICIHSVLPGFPVLPGILLVFVNPGAPRMGFLLTRNSFSVDSLVTHYPFFLKWEPRLEAPISNFHLHVVF